MEIRRTANAGVLLKLDETTILLDGVCRGVAAYPATPPAERERLMQCPPDIVAFTHVHEDHFDDAYVKAYHATTGRQVLSTAQAAALCPDCVSVLPQLQAGKVQVKAVKTRHLGAAGKTTEHQGFVVQGSRTAWFLGDGAPAQLKNFADFPKPDVLFVPFPYVSTLVGVELLRQFLPCRIVLLHMPVKQADEQGIWASVQSGVEQLKDWIFVPELGETWTL